MVCGSHRAGGTVSAEALRNISSCPLPGVYLGGRRSREQAPRSAGSRKLWHSSSHAIIVTEHGGDTQPPADAEAATQLDPLASHEPAPLTPLQPPSTFLPLPLLAVCTAQTITATRNPGTSFFQLSGFY